MSTARMTVGALLGTVTTTANAVTGTVNGIAKGVGMFDTWIDQLATEQRIRAIGHKERAKTMIAQDLAMEEAERIVSIEEFCSKSPSHLSHFQTAHSKYEALLKDA